MNLAAGQVAVAIWDCAGSAHKAPLCGGTCNDKFPLCGRVDSTNTGLPPRDHFVGSGAAPALPSSKVSQNWYLQAVVEPSAVASPLGKASSWVPVSASLCPASGFFATAAVGSTRLPLTAREL